MRSASRTAGRCRVARSDAPGGSSFSCNFSAGHFDRPAKSRYLCRNYFLKKKTVAKSEKTKVDNKQYVETPLMKQYYSIKAVHPDAILLFRVGDFYETFGEDAIRASGILGITLTRRANGAASYVELAGFPYHAIDTYLPKLVRAGERVAICEQLEDPKLVKGLVKRGVIELVTPGVVLEENILSNKENIYLASIYLAASRPALPSSTSQPASSTSLKGAIRTSTSCISNFAPKEIIYQRGYEDRFRRPSGRSTTPTASTSGSFRRR